MSVNNSNTAIRMREFLLHEPKVLLDNYSTDTLIMYDDNEVMFHNHKEIILNRYILELIKPFNELPILSKYSIHNYYTNGIFTSKSVNKCFEVIKSDIINKALKPFNRLSEIEFIDRAMFFINNNIYNDIGYGRVEYVSSLNILNFIDIQYNNKLMASIEKVAETNSVDDINACHDVLDHVMRYDGAYKHNPLARGYISGRYNPGQIKQMLGVVGYVTEIDGSIFKYPMVSSYTLGMNNLYEMAIQSRNGAKALHLSNVAVSDSEYLAREMSLITMNVENIEFGDCGGGFIDWYVRPETPEHQCDIVKMLGTYYLNDDGVLEVITANHIHLAGKTIKIRNTIKCKHKDKRTVCSTCFGELAYSVYKHTNLGNVCSGTTTKQSTQSILSTKHLITSATGGGVVLSEEASRYFILKNKNEYAFKTGVLKGKNTKYYLIIDQYELFGLKDLKTIDNLSKLDPTRISKIENMLLIAESPIGKDYCDVNVKTRGVCGSLTYAFIEYIMDNNYKLNNEGKYIIDVSNWKSNVPIISMPQIEFSYLALANEIKDLLKSNKHNGKKLNNITSEHLLQLLFDLVNSKLSVNLSVLSVIVYAFTIKSSKDFNFDLARNCESDETSTIKRIMPNRSLGGGYAHEYVTQMIMSPLSYSNKNRTNHILDVMVRPAEVLADYYRDKK